MLYGLALTCFLGKVGLSCMSLTWTSGVGLSFKAAGQRCSAVCTYGLDDASP